MRRREVEIEVFDDIVLLVAMKTQAEIGSRRELHILKRRKIVPGSVLLKHFRNIACGDLYALFPNARVVMSNFDKAFLSVPAIAGGISILLKLYATISVLFLVVGIYFGGSGSAADADMKTAQRWPRSPTGGDREQPRAIIHIACQQDRGPGSTIR